MLNILNNIFVFRIQLQKEHHMQTLTSREKAANDNTASSFIWEFTTTMPDYYRNKCSKLVLWCVAYFAAHRDVVPLELIHRIMSDDQRLDKLHSMDNIWHEFFGYCLKHNQEQLFRSVTDDLSFIDVAYVRNCFKRNVSQHYYPDDLTEPWMPSRPSIVSCHKHFFTRKYRETEHNMICAIVSVHLSKAGLLDPIIRIIESFNNE